MNNAMNDTVVVSMHDVVRSFGTVRAVDHFSLQVKRGEIYGLIGPDGAGKTTIMRLLSGALEADQGSIHVTGLDVNKEADRIKERIGYMPQLYGLYSDLTVYENLVFFLKLFGVDPKLREPRIIQLLEFVRLNEFKDRRAGALSGGMYKKLAIACSILHRPDVLLLDEPTNGVDPVSRRDLWALLFSLVEDGVSVLVSTPYMDEAERCHRVGLVYDGALLRQGSPSKLLDELQGRVFVKETEHATDELPDLRSHLPKDTITAIAQGGIRIVLPTRQASQSYRFKEVNPTIEDLLIVLQNQKENEKQRV